jgi:fructosamine-3-kinase
MSSVLLREIEAALGLPAEAISPLSGGSVGEVYKAQLSDNRTVVVKVDQTGEQQLTLEGFMLRYLAEESRLPVPEVLFSKDGLLVLEFLPGRSTFSPAAQRCAAELLADLHDISGPSFGFERDTLIGGLHQPNPWANSWLEFFRDNRLLFMGNMALEAGRLPGAIYQRLMRFGKNLSDWLEEPEHPSLIHGDAWAGNILAEDDEITGFLDPAIYFADPEIELAFTSLFGTFGDPFFQHYHEIRPIKPGFMDSRRHIYNLYPLLVHVRLFGGSYVSSVDQTLRRFGY